MTQHVVTVIGDDREGLISELAALVAQHEGNWLDSSFARLAGKFSGVVLLDIAPERADALDAAVRAHLEERGWHVEIAPVPEASAPGVHVPATSSPRLLHLVGHDRPGMVAEVSRALGAQRLTIDSFDSWTSAAPHGGGVLFEADVVVRLADGTDADAVRDALEEIAAELMVDLGLDDTPESGDGS